MSKVTERKDASIRPLDFLGLVSVLLSVAKGQFMTITADTSVKSKMTAANKRAWGDRIIKRSTVQTQSYIDYKTAVENEAKRNGTEAPEIKQRSWGVRLADTPFTVHRSKGAKEASFYLPTNIINTLGYVFLDRETGEELSKDFVFGLYTPYNQKPKPVSKTGKFYREYKVDGIVSLSAGGRKYVIAENFKYPVDGTAKTADEMYEILKGETAQA